MVQLEFGSNERKNQFYFRVFENDIVLTDQNREVLNKACFFLNIFIIIPFFADSMRSVIEELFCVWLYAVYSLNPLRPFVNSNLHELRYFFPVTTNIIKSQLFGL